MIEEHRRSGPPSTARVAWLSRFRLERLDPDRFDACVRHVEVCDGFALSYLTFGGPVEIEIGPLLETYLAVVPVRGEVRLSGGRIDVCATVTRAVVVDPADGHWQVWSAGAEVLFVHVHVSRVLAVAGRRGCARPRQVLDLATPAGRKWLESLMSLIRRIDELGPDEQGPADAAYRVDEMTRSLLLL